MVNELKLAVAILHTKTRCRSVHACGFTAGQKTMENQNWATGPPGRWAVVVAGRGLRAGGPSGRRAVTGRRPVFSKTLAESRQFKCNTSAKCVTVVQITHCNSGLWLVERLTNFVAQWYHVKQWHRPFTTKSDLNTNKQPPRIYGLLKIHKADIPYHDL